MKNLFYIFLFLACGLNSATLMTQELFDNGSSVDIKLSFDSPFNGKVYQSKEGSNLVITLDKTTANEKFTNQLNSKIVNEFIIQNRDNSVEITAKGSKDLKAEATSSQDGLSLNIKFSDSSIGSVDVTPEPLQTKEPKKGWLNLGLVFVIAGLFIATALVFFLFKRARKPKNGFEFSIFDDKFENKNDGFSKNLEPNFESVNLAEDTKTEAKEEEKVEIEEVKNDEPLKMKTQKETYFENNPELTENGDIKIIHKSKINDEKEMILLENNGKKYIAFLSKDNEIPTGIFDGMMKNDEKFKQFLQICKNQNGL